jgi:Transmembrane domain of unknown function (DUF3566)
LSSREERPSSWRTDPEATPASGGHLAPDLTATGSPYDPLSAPLPSELERQRRDRTEVIPRSAPPTAPPPMRRPRGSSRRVKRTLRHVDPLGVLKLSLFFYTCLLVLWLIFVAFLFWFIEGQGFFNLVEGFTTGMALDNPEITLGLVEKWAFLLGFTLVVMGSLLNTFLAFLYNVGADILGGLDLTFVERDLGG